MEYLIHLAILVGIYSVLGISLNLVVGYAGLLSITQAAFYGIGGYSTAILLSNFGMNFFLSVIIGVAITVVVSLAIGYVLSRFRGDFFALGSFGFNIIIYSIMLNWQGLTRGPLGIPGISRPNLFGFVLSDNIHFLALVAVIVALIYFVSLYVVNSSFGQILKAIREDEDAISVFGYNTLFYKLTIFVISSGMAAVAGSL